MQFNISSVEIEVEAICGWILGQGNAAADCSKNKEVTQVGIRMLGGGLKRAGLYSLKNVRKSWTPKELSKVASSGGPGFNPC